MMSVPTERLARTVVVIMFSCFESIRPQTSTNGSAFLNAASKPHPLPLTKRLGKVINKY
jgi:hypothetical protein